MMKKTQSTVPTSVTEEVAAATSQLVCKQQSHAMQCRSRKKEEAATEGGNGTLQ
jgi:hypothetical protein